KNSKQRFFLEAIMYSLVIVLGFVISSTYFTLTDYEANFTYIDEKDAETEITYNMPPVFGMNEYVQLTEGTMTPWVETPAVVNASKLTTVFWSFVFGTFL